jgi:3-oxoisoapionate kinase
MREHLAPALAALAALGAPVLHYKVCSTFDSSPAIGSIGCAIDLGVPLMRGRWSPLLVGAPRLGRYQPSATCSPWSRAATGSTATRRWRAIRSRRWTSRTCGLHLARQTARRIELVDFTQLKAGQGAAGDGCGAGRRRRAGGAARRAGRRHAARRRRLVWERARRGRLLRLVVGLSYALAAHWQASGWSPAQPRCRGRGPVDVHRRGQRQLFAGTAAQIAWARAHGFAVVRLDAAAAAGRPRRGRDRACGGRRGAALARPQPAGATAPPAPTTPRCAASALAAAAGLSRARSRGRASARRWPR